jgi:hypothetical protein
MQTCLKDHCSNLLKIAKTIQIRCSNKKPARCKRALLQAAESYARGWYCL